MSKVIKVIKKVNNNLEENNLDKFLRNQENIERQQKIEYLLTLVRENPNITEEMIRPDLRKYLGIVRREYKKEMALNDYSQRKSR